MDFSELYVCGVKFAYVSVNYSSCFNCCVFHGVGELFVECVCNLLVCGGCFVAERDSVVVCLGRFVPSPCIVIHSMRVLFVVSSFV